jgi:hypothetical protein
MSRCNFGYPAKDLALQNLTVNDITRVENLIKSTKSEIDTLCVVNDYLSKASVIYNGSRDIMLPGDSPPETKQTTLPSNYRIYALPCGVFNRFKTNVPYTDSSNPSLSFCIYTDIDLLVKKMQAVVSTTIFSSNPFMNNVNVSLEYGETPTNLTNLITLKCIDTSERILPPVSPITFKSPVKVTTLPDNVIIPAGSYYTLMISEGENSTPNGVTRLTATWTIHLEPI